MSSNECIGRLGSWEGYRVGTADRFDAGVKGSRPEIWIELHPDCRFSRPWDPCFSKAFHPGSPPRVTLSACLMSSSGVQSPFERGRRRACGACGRRGVRAVQGPVGNAERFPGVRQDPRASSVVVECGGDLGCPTQRSSIVGHPMRPFSPCGDSRMV